MLLVFVAVTYTIMPMTASPGDNRITTGSVVISDSTVMGNAINPNDSEVLPGEYAKIKVISEFGDKEQEQQLERINVSDPYYVIVIDEDQAGETVGGLGVSYYYDNINVPPRDDMSNGELQFNSNGVAITSIGSEETNAENIIWIGPMSEDASVVDNIIVPDGVDAVWVQVETEA